MTEFWLYLHILLLVFWVGTDLGVFVASRYSERSELSYETRMTVLDLGMKLDRLPRSALALIIPSGCSLADSMGLVALDSSYLFAIWGAGVVWLVILWTGFLSKDLATQGLAARINWILNVAMAVLVSAVGVYLLVGGLTPSWLVWKIIAVGGIFIVGSLLDIFFKPAVDLFMQLAESPEDATLNQKYSRALAPVYVTVIAIYVLALGAAALGVFK